MVATSVRAREDVVCRANVGLDQNQGASGAPEASRIVVIDSNLLTAEAIVFALTQLNFSARFVVPVTPGPLWDLVTWKPELALLDIDSVESSMCLNCVAVLRGAGVPVAVMGSRPDTSLLGECIEAGVSSVVDKSSPLSELVAIILRMLAGDVVLDEEERRRLTEPCQRESLARRNRLAPFDILTRREKSVLAGLMEGNCAEVIARNASVSISTVRSQIKSILQKLGVNSQLAAAALALQAGWALDPTDEPTDTHRGERASQRTPRAIAGSRI